MKSVSIKDYDNSWYRPGGAVKRLLWYFVNVLFFLNPFNPFSGIKVRLLRLFGAQVGVGVNIKPNVNIGTNVCISQGAMLLCGNHNYKLPTFDLIVKPIIIENGAWVGAKSTVCPGVTLHTHAVLGVGSVANHDLDAYSIYQGNPAIKIRKRVMEA